MIIFFTRVQTLFGGSLMSQEYNMQTFGDLAVYLISSIKTFLLFGL